MNNRMTLEEVYQEQALNFMEPVMKASVLMAAKYCHSTGRTVVTPLDFEYAHKYCAMNLDKVPDLLEGIGDEEIDEDDEWTTDEENEFVVDESELGFDDEFRPYEGSDEEFLDVNQSVSQWRDWEPEDMFQNALKNSINRAFG